MKRIIITKIIMKKMQKIKKKMLMKIIMKLKKKKKKKKKKPKKIIITIPKKKKKFKLIQKQVFQQKIPKTFRNQKNIKKLIMYVILILIFQLNILKKKFQLKVFQMKILNY